MAKIVAIGGGEIMNRETLSIDREIMKFSGKKKPRLLFIPTASRDAEGYVTNIQKYFDKELGCVVDVLFVTKNSPKKRFLEEKILGADIIYVGGGNTLFMMMRWRKLGIDRILRKALKKDVVLCGISAGSICWFNSGNSDSRKFTSGSKKLIKVMGLGFIDAVHCPHYDVEKFRKKDLKRMMKKDKHVAIALENNCALQIHNDTYRIITSDENARAYKVYWDNGEYYENIIEYERKFRPLTYLLKK
jgi:dipeptidase E